MINDAKKIFKKLVLASLIMCVICVSLFCVIVFVDFDKPVYKHLMKYYDDSYSQQYLEKTSNMVSPQTHYASTFNTYKTISNALTKEIEYLAPMMLYAKLPSKEISEAKKLSKQFKNSKDYFEPAMHLLDSHISSYHGAINTEVDKTYYMTYLPRYSQYIEAKFNMATFIQRVLIRENLINASAKNVTELQHVLIDFGITFVMPSIIVIYNQDSAFKVAHADYEKPITNSSAISLAKLASAGGEFDLVVSQNKFPSNASLVQTFEDSLNNIKIAYYGAKQIFEGFTQSQKNVYLMSNKAKPTASPENFMETTLAKNDGTFPTLLNDGTIAAYFGG